MSPFNNVGWHVILIEPNGNLPTHYFGGLWLWIDGIWNPKGAKSNTWRYLFLKAVNNVSWDSEIEKKALFRDQFKICTAKATQEKNGISFSILEIGTSILIEILINDP